MTERGEMTYRLTIGVDPGLSGAVAILADGRFVDVIDMPTAGRGKAGRQTVNSATLAAYLREHVSAHPGATVLAAVEAVGSMPGQGVSSTFRFGESCGAVAGVLAALRIPVVRPAPAVWKRSFALIGSEKDASRGAAIDRFPDAPLSRKRDHGRAEALLIAAWAYRTEALEASA